MVVLKQNACSLRFAFDLIDSALGHYHRFYMGQKKLNSRRFAASSRLSNQNSKRISLGVGASFFIIMVIIIVLRQVGESLQQQQLSGPTLAALAELIITQLLALIM